MTRTREENAADLADEEESEAGTYNLTMEVYVFNPEALLKVATAHAQRTTESVHTKIDNVEDALVMLLDPGGGGANYTGNLNEAGIEIVGTSTEKSR